MPQVDHLVQPGSKKIVRRHCSFPLISLRFYPPYFNFSGIPIGKFIAKILGLSGIRRFCRGDYEVARKMEAEEIAWDSEIQYVCRKVSLQLCKHHGPNDLCPLGLVDHMIYPLLLPDEELVFELQPGNSLAC